MDLISIIIPFKNTESFILECLQSIVNQSYKNFEAICINDHSSDKTEEIIFQLTKKDTRFKLIHNNGKGIIPALKKGYSVCKGTYITRMDSDDIMSPNKLEIMHKQLKNKGKGCLATGLVKYFSESILGEGFQKYEQWLNNLTERGLNFSDIYKECVIPSPCWMLHREDFDKCDGFNSTLYPEDYDLAFRFYKNNLKVIPSSYVLHQWRDYKTRTSRTHKHYSDNGFLDIKTKYYLELEYKPEKPLILWGAGKKGKTIAKKLIAQQIPFRWVCDNPNKEGRDIYGVKLESYKNIALSFNQQHIISIAAVSAREYLEQIFKKNTTNYHFFC